MCLLFFLREPSTTGTYLTCAAVNIAFMGIRVSFRFYEYTNLLYDPYMIEQCGLYYLLFYVNSFLWSIYLVYTNYVFYIVDQPQDTCLVAALMLLTFFGYIVMIEGIIFNFFIVAYCSMYFYFSEDNTNSLNEVNHVLSIEINE